MPPRESRTDEDRARRREYYRRNSEKVLAGNARWVAKNLTQVRRVQAASKIKLRADRRKLLIDMYGGKCECCDETEVAFLAIDHIAGGGSKHIRSFKGPTPYYNWLIALGRKRNGFRVLCHNCNFATHVYGVCPHRRIGCRLESQT